MVTFSHPGFGPKTSPQRPTRNTTGGGGPPRMGPKLCKTLRKQPAIDRVRGTSSRVRHAMSPIGRAWCRCGTSRRTIRSHCGPFWAPFWPHRGRIAWEPKIGCIPGRTAQITAPFPHSNPPQLVVCTPHDGPNAHHNPLPSKPRRGGPQATGYGPPQPPIIYLSWAKQTESRQTEGYFLPNQLPINGAFPSQWPKRALAT